MFPKKTRKSWIRIFCCSFSGASEPPSDYELPVASINPPTKKRGQRRSDPAALEVFCESATKPVSEVEAKRCGDRAWRHIMCSAECRQEVIEHVIVCQIDECDLGAPFVPLAMKQVVMTDGEVEEVSGCNARRIVIVVFGVRRRHLY